MRVTTPGWKKKAAKKLAKQGLGDASSSSPAVQQTGPAAEPLAQPVRELPPTIDDAADLF